MCRSGHFELTPADSVGGHIIRSPLLCRRGAVLSSFLDFQVMPGGAARVASFGTATVRRLLSTTASAAKPQAAAAAESVLGVGGRHIRGQAGAGGAGSKASIASRALGGEPRRQLRQKGHHQKGHGHHKNLSHGYLGTHGRNWAYCHSGNNRCHHHQGYNSSAGGQESNTGGNNGSSDPSQNDGVSTITLTVNAPPNGNVAPAGYYWLHVTDQGAFKDSAGKWQEGHWVPNWEGAVVQVTR